MAWQRELDEVVGVVRQAGKKVRQIAASGFQTQRKKDNSPLTIADLEVNRMLKDHLTGCFPNYGWLSEETADQPDRLQRECVWIVDPIDGTKEFTQGIAEYAISVALVCEGKAVLGVIHNPKTEEMAMGAEGIAVRWNGHEVAVRQKLTDRPEIEASRSDVAKGRFAPYENIFTIRPCGSIAYKLGRLSGGMADAVFSMTPKNEWDIAAGVALVQEAGGRCTDIEGRPFVFNRRTTRCEGIIAAGKQSFDHIRSMIEQGRSGFAASD